MARKEVALEVATNSQVSLNWPYIARVHLALIVKLELELQTSHWPAD